MLLFQMKLETQGEDQWIFFLKKMETVLWKRYSHSATVFWEYYVGMLNIKHWESRRLSEGHHTLVDFQ